MNLGIMSGVVLLINLPFGCWRASVQKFSWEWFLAVHIPIALAVAFRLLSGMGWRISSVPVFAGVYFTGQLLGARIYRNRAGRKE